MALEFRCLQELAVAHPELESELLGLQEDAKATIGGDVEGFVESALGLLISPEYTPFAEPELTFARPAKKAELGWPRIMTRND